MLNRVMMKTNTKQESEEKNNELKWNEKNCIDDEIKLNIKRLVGRN